MKVIIVNCFDSSIDRVQSVKKYFEAKKHEVMIIQSDFLHVKKQKRADKKEGYIFVDTISYKKNLSIRRLYSHYDFARKAFKIVENYNPDIVYTIVPPNSLTKFAAKYRKKHNTKLILDVYDLWPESIPSDKIKKILAIPFKMWRNLRDKNLSKADFVITECNLYQEKLKKQLLNQNTKTVYLTRETVEGEIVNNLRDDAIDIAYLGAISNLINIPLIVDIAEKINNKKKVKLHIIGDGEKRDIFLNALKEKNIDYEYYGIVYDRETKKEIFDKCYYGLNLMKESVTIGLTMKSLDYFNYGLPIINNIKYDTEEIVNKYNIGYNFTSNNSEEKINQIIEIKAHDVYEMKKNTKEVFNEIFEISKFNKSMDEVIKKVVI